MSINPLSSDLNVVQNTNDAGMTALVASLVIPQLTDDLDIIQKLDDEPNDVGGLTAAELKAKFDESGNTIKEYINDTLLPAISDTVAEEEARDEAEQARETAEAARVTAEQGRVSAEQERVTAEQGRASAEGSRASAEGSRASAEGLRVTAEQGRVSAEEARVQAEALRESTTNGIVVQATEQAGLAQQAKEAAAASAAAAALSQQTVAGQAEQLVQNASKQAQSWAVGGTGSREGEDTNNAKYWAEQAENAAGGGVTSFNGRTGTVVPAEGDYTAEMIGADTTGSAANALAQAKSYADEKIGAAAPAPSQVTFTSGSWGTEDETSGLYTMSITKEYHGRSSGKFSYMLRHQLENGMSVNTWAVRCTEVIYDSASEAIKLISADAYPGEIVFFGP